MDVRERIPHNRICECENMHPIGTGLINKQAPKLPVTETPHQLASDRRVQRSPQNRPHFHWSGEYIAQIGEPGL